MRKQPFLGQIRRERPRRLRPLAQLAIVDAARVVSADPLAPAVQMEVAPGLVPRERGVSDEPEVGLTAQRGQALGQTLDAGRQPAGPRVRIETLEGEDVELQGWFLRLLPEPRGVSELARRPRLEKSRDPNGRAAKA